jgi:hypothetical protein
MTQMKCRKKIGNKQSLRKYTLCLLDQNQKSLASSGIFNSSPEYKEKNKDIALSIIQFAIEDILQWTPEEALNRLNVKVVKEMKLEDAIAKLNLPDGVILDNDYSYIISMIYPRIKVDINDLTIKFYKTVLDEDTSKTFTRRYFSHIDGRKRSAICLHYLIERVSSFFTSVQDMYEFFSGVGGDRFLTNNKLKLAKSQYTSDVEYLHNSLAKSQRDDFMFHYYQSAGLFWGTKRKISKIGRATEKVERTLSQNSSD